MKFVPYSLTEDRSVVAFQADGVEAVAAADVSALLAQVNPAHLLVHFPWFGMYGLGPRLGRVQREHGGHCKIHLMVNTAEEVRGFRPSGLPVRHAPASIFVPEQVFTIQCLPKRYDAIYIGHFRPGHREDVKRHDLAARVRQLRLITYPVRHEVENGSFVRHFLSNFPELHYAEVNDSYLQPEEVATAINEARVHLALSAVEGCMYAFTEGLLCGVPAVSTVCKGGREQFFEPRCVEIVDAEPKSVAAAVQRAAARRPNPVTIRRLALSRLEHYRRRYLAYVAALTGGDPDDLYDRIFRAPQGPASFCFDFDRATALAVAVEEERASWYG